MILTDRISGRTPPKGALDALLAFYGPGVNGNVVQHWATRDAHLFVVLVAISGRCDCVSVHRGIGFGIGESGWITSPDSRTSLPRP